MPRDKAQYNERMRDYMRDYRTRERERQARKDAWMDDATRVFKEDFIRHYVAEGHTREQGEDYWDTYCTPPELQEPDEPESIGIASDSIPEDKRHCFGKQEPGDCGCLWHDKCSETWRARRGVELDNTATLQRCITLRVKKDSETIEVARQKCQKILSDSIYSQMDSTNSDQLELMVNDWDKREEAERRKPQTQKDAENDAKKIAFLKEYADFKRKSDLQNRIRIGAAILAKKDARQKEIDLTAKKYMDRGIPEKTARQDAELEMKQIENAKARESNSFERKWNLMTEDEQFELKMKLYRDGKKLLEGKSIQPSTADYEHGQDPDEYGKTDSEIRELRKKKEEKLKLLSENKKLLEDLK